MNFVLRKSESRIADRHYLMDIPVGALVVAPDVFFARFGKTFSIPLKENLQKDLSRNELYHAVPSDEKRKDTTPYVVRRIHSSRVKDALAGKMTKELLSPKDNIGDLLIENKKSEPKEEEKKAEVVNIFAMTLPQLREFATSKGIKNVEKASRTQLTKELQKILAEAEK